MIRQRVWLLICVLIAGGLAFEPGPLRGQSDLVISINKPMPAPAWALAERRLLALNAEGVALWASKYLDANGYLLGAANWGIEDGPDDAVESIRNWPLAHALGGPESIIQQWDRAWEGHLDQYTKAKDPSTELAKDGMYYKEFPTAYDWEHIGEGLGPFYWYGLSRPTDQRYANRLRRWSGLYMNEDPEAKNYDAKLKIIPSLFNGSKGAKLTNNTQEDWNGRLLPGTKPSTRFLKATNILGDHPAESGGDQSCVSRVSRDAGREVQDVAARVRRCVEDEDCRKRRQHPVEHRAERRDWRRMGRQVVRRGVRMEFAG